MKKLLIVVSSLAILTGCSIQTETQTPDVEPVESNQKIVTSFYPLEYITKEIVGSNFEVLNLTNSKDPHSYSITPQDIAQVELADLFVFQGAGLESWAEDLAKNRTKSNLQNFEVADQIELHESSHDHSHDHEEESHDEHNDEHHGDHEDDGDHEDHKEENHTNLDPHTWLDPILLSETAAALADEIILIDPDNKETYVQNLLQLQASLKELDQDYAAGLSACENKHAIVSHNAFAYLQERHNFELISIAGLSPQSEPTSQDLTNIIQTSQDENITHILLEKGNNQSFSKTIKTETALKTLEINPLESTPSNQDYIQAMKQNLVSFQAAFNCN